MQVEESPGRTLEPLLCTSSVDEAQSRGVELLAPHRLRTHGPRFEARINGVSLPTLSLYHMRYGAPLTVDSEPTQD